MSNTLFSSPEQNATGANLDHLAQEMVQKSMTTGYAIGGTDQEGAAAVRYQSLANAVKLLTFGNADFTIFNDLPRETAKSTVEQYAIQTGYGRAGSSLFVPETGVGAINDPELSQKLARMKFVSDTRQTSIASTLVNNVANPLQIQESSALIAIAKTIEYGAFYGDEDLSAKGQGQGLEFNGLAKLVDQKNNIMDLRGEALTERVLNQASVVVGKGFGRATDAYMPIGVHAEFVNQILPRQWVNQGAQGNVNSGFNVPTFISTRGAIRLHGSTIMDNEKILDETVLLPANAPVAPTVTATVATGAGGRFRENEVKTHEYAVRVISSTGPSVATKVQAVVANATDAVTLEVVPANLYQALPDYVEVYRKGNETDAFYLVARVGTHELAANANKIVDKNDELPETADVFVGELSKEVLALYELLPMTRIPLAQVNATLTFTVLWYGALALFAPKKWVHVKNVKYSPEQVY